jgi:hypothetical protein
MKKVRKIGLKRIGRVSQGDIYKDVEVIDNVLEKGGIIQIFKIVFPLVIVLTQDCDLEQDYKTRSVKEAVKDQDKLIFSVLVAPLYNVEHVLIGEHLQQLNIKMQIFDSKTQKNNLFNNEVPRYHYLDISSEVPITASIIDFKHYFSIHVDYLRGKTEDFICRVSPLYREDISDRFASYLARIGLPKQWREK